MAFQLIKAGVSSVTFFGQNILDDAMDDGSPYTVQELDQVGVGGNAAGNMVYYIKPALAMVSVTVGPTSNACSNLFSKLANYRNRDSDVSADGEFTVTGIGGDSVYNYSQGILVSGGGGSMQADGKLGGVTFTGAFYQIR